MNAGTRTLFSVVLVLSLAAMAGLASAQRMILGPGGLLDDLPELTRDRVSAVSSHDRTGGNNDGFDGTYSYLRRDPNGEYVLSEEEGPGALVRMWWTAPDPAKQVRFYFDGEETPRIDIPVRELFTGNTFPFVRPLVGDDTVSSGGFYTYLALPYRKSLKITSTGVARFYSFSSIRFDEDRNVTTYDPVWTDKDRQQLEAVCLKLATPGIDPKSVGNETTDERTQMLVPGSRTAIFSQDGRGVITKLRVRMESADPHAWRKVVVRAWWDGAEKPAIEAPLGDFFGSGFGYTEHHAQAVGMASSWAYCYFPMPFRKSARIEIENGSGEPVPVFWSSVSYEKKRVPDHWGYFHARWRQTITEMGKYYEILHDVGRGKFVGCNISMTGTRYAYLEGDEKIYVDGEDYPSTHGTGTEDYFMGGWYFNHGAFSCPWHGLSVKDESTHRISAYRHHVPDAIPYQEKIRVDIEHGPGNDEPDTEYCGVAYWYQAEPAMNPDTFPPLVASTLKYSGRRLAVPHDLIQAESLSVQSSNGAHRIRNWDDISDIYDGGAQVYLDAAEGDWIELTGNMAYADRCAFRVHLATGPEYGRVQVHLNGEPWGEPLDCSTGEAHLSREFGLPQVPLGQGPYTVRLVSLGPGAAGTGSAMGLDGWRLPSESAFVSELMLIGPFPNPGRPKALAEPFPPESEIDLSARYDGANDLTVSWKRAAIGDDHTYNFLNHFQRTRNVIAYAWVRVHSETERTVLCMLGSDDSVKVWVNGETVHALTVARGVMIDQDRFPVTFQPGWNDVLVKVEQGTGEWGLAIRFTDPGGLLRYSLEQP